MGGQVTAPPTRDGLAVTPRTGYQATLHNVVSRHPGGARVLCKSVLAHTCLISRSLQFLCLFS